MVRLNNLYMKRIFIFLMVCAFALSLTVQAQERKDKVKHTSTIPQKIHNTFSKHKKHNGVKVKHKREYKKK